MRTVQVTVDRAPESPVQIVGRLHRERVELERQEQAAVRAARAAGETWTSLAAVLGVSPQAVQKRYGR